MKSKREIRDKINVAKLSENGKSRHYILSYKGNEGKTDPQDMSIQDMIEYVVVNYKYNNNMDEGKLINDLIIFKTYKDDLTLEMNSKERFINCYLTTITVFIGLSTLRLALADLELKDPMINVPDTAFPNPMIDFEEIYRFIKDFIKNAWELIKESKEILVLFLGSFLIVSVLNYFFTKKDSELNRLKTVNNVIHILESIK